MARIPRIIGSSGIYHVMLRGVNKTNIFEDDQDYYVFLKHLRWAKEKYDIKIYCYCLMSNHVHLMIRDKSNHLSQAIHDLSVDYSRYFNLKHDRSGHLFQDRFRSKPVETREYFYQLLAYIIFNPEAAGLSRYNTYRWSSYRDFYNSGGVTDTSAIMTEVGSIKGFQELMKNAEHIYPSDAEFTNAISDQDIIKLINTVAKVQASKIAQLPIEQRNDVLRMLMANGIKSRQLSRVTGISYNTIVRL